MCNGPLCPASLHSVGFVSHHRKRARNAGSEGNLDPCLKQKHKCPKPETISAVSKAMTVNLCPRRLKTCRDRGTSKEILRAQWPSDPLTYSSSLYYSVTFPSSCSVGSRAAAAVVWHSSLCLWHTRSPRTLLFITTSWSWLLKIICYLGSSGEKQRER